MKIVKIDDVQAGVQSGDCLRNVNISLVKNVAVGDYILVHGDMAINKLEKEEAEKILEMIDGHCHCD